jgi:Protein of unknown function (DUF4229)
VSEEPSDNSTRDPADDQSGRVAGERTGNHVVVDVLVYAAARLLLVVAITGAIYGIARLLGVTEFPIVVPALFALIIAMPLGIWLFSPLRRRATAALATAGDRRRREREQLQARLRGESVADAPCDDE